MEEENKTTLETLEEIQRLNQEILEGVKFIKNYFRWRMIWSGVKTVFLVILIILSFYSVKLMTSYLQTAPGLDIYSGQINNLKNILPQ